MADNPYINKVVFGDQTLIDLTDATATAADIAQGATAYGASGELLTGTASGGGRCAWYGTSNTAASTAAKVVTCEGFTLAAGNVVAVFFTTGNTAATPTLDVNGTGAKSIYVGGSAPNSTTNVLKWSANTLLVFAYDGTQYRYISSQTAGSVQQPDGAGAWYGTANTAQGTAAKTTTITNFRLTRGAVVAVRFSTANTVAGAITLNVNSTGAKTIYTKSGATSSSNTLTWAANTTLLFVYSGSYWYYLGSDRDGGGSYELPTASIDTKGGVKLPDDWSLWMDGEVLRVSAGNAPIWGDGQGSYYDGYASVKAILTAGNVPVLVDTVQVGDPNNPEWINLPRTVKDVVIDDVGDGLGVITLFFEKYDSTAGVMVTYGASVSEEDDSWDIAPISNEIQRI